MVLIANYGLFWRRSRVGYRPGKSNNPSSIGSEEWPRSGELLGVGVRKKRQGLVNFAQQRGIYALYDEQFRLVYVGQAGRNKGGLYKRLRSHTVTGLAERWSRFSWFGICPVIEDVDGEGRSYLIEDKNDEEVSFSRHVIFDHIEAVLLSAGEPLRNKQGGRFGKDVTHYRQYKGDIDKNEEIESDDENE